MKNVPGWGRVLRWYFIRGICSYVIHMGYIERLVTLGRFLFIHFRSLWTESPKKEQMLPKVNRVLKDSWVQFGIGMDAIVCRDFGQNRLEVITWMCQSTNLLHFERSIFSFPPGDLLHCFNEKVALKMNQKVSLLVVIELILWGDNFLPLVRNKVHPFHWKSLTRRDCVASQPTTLANCRAWIAEPTTGPSCRPQGFHPSLSDLVSLFKKSLWKSLFCASESLYP